MCHNKRVLFICKKRNNSYGHCFGLHNSARFVSSALNKINIHSKVVQVIDNNDIDKQIFLYLPTDVIIEALWVVPSKLKILMEMYPKINWYVRLHSKTPFLASEGVAVKWIKEYSTLPQKHFCIAANNLSLITDIEKTFLIRCCYQPNIYDEEVNRYYHEHCHNKIINVGCFGAIRPLKNHLAQAFAAIRFADHIKRQLKFHINGSRVETKGEEVIKNLRNLFPIREHELIEHHWLEHDNFLKLVSSMDIGMQVSLSESFNIVTADFIFQNISIVVSSDITWMPDVTKANPCDPDSIYKTLERVWNSGGFLNSLNIKALQHHNKESLEVWIKLLNDR